MRHRTEVFWHNGGWSGWRWRCRTCRVGDGIYSDHDEAAYFGNRHATYDRAGRPRLQESA